MPIRVADLLPHLFEGFLEVDRSLRVREINGNAESMLRLDRSLALGKPLDAVIRDGRQSQHWSTLVEHIQAGRETTISVFLPEQYRWLEIRIVPSGRNVALLFQDTTDRQWIIRREAERVYLKGVFEDAPVALAILRGPKLVIEYMNAFARNLAGPRRVIGYPLREAFPDVPQTELFEIMEKVYRESKPYRGVEQFVQWKPFLQSERVEGYFDVSYLPIRDFDGTTNGILSVSVDVTERVIRGRVSAAAAHAAVHHRSPKPRPEKSKFS